MLRAPTLVLASLVSSLLLACVERGQTTTVASVVDVATPAMPTATTGITGSLPATCHWKAAGEPVRIARDGESPSFVTAATTGGRTLIAYQVPASAPDRSTTIRGRLLDERGAPIGDELSISERNGIFVAAQILVDGDRFFVAWDHQHGVAGFPGEFDVTMEGRWVAPDGRLTPQVSFTPTRPHEHGRLTRVPEGISMISEHVRDGGGSQTVTRIVHALPEPSRGGATRPGRAVPLLDATIVGDGRDVHELPLPDGGSWIALVSTGFKVDTLRVHLVRVDRSGRVVSQVKEIASDDHAARPRLLAVDDGMLLGWMTERDIGRSPVTAFVARLDARGNVLGDPTRIGTGQSNRHGGADFVLAGGVPTFVFDGQLVAVGKQAEILAPAVRVTPETAAHGWFSGSRDAAGIVWVDEKDRDESVHRTALTCKTR